MTGAGRDRDWVAAAADRLVAQLDVTVRLCRLPGCGRPVRSLRDREAAAGRLAPPGPGAGQDDGASVPGRAGEPAAGGPGGPGRSGGRLPEYCSTLHQQLSNGQVRWLQGLVEEAERLRGASVGRTARRLDRVLSDLEGRIARHGVTGWTGPGRTLRVPDGAGGPVAAGPSGRRPVEDGAPVPPGSAGPLAGQVAGRGASDGDGPGVPAGGAVAVLGLGDPSGRELFDEAWARFREAARAVRDAAGAYGRVPNAAARAAVADAWLGFVELSQAAEQVLDDLVVLPAPVRDGHCP